MSQIDLKLDAWKKKLLDLGKRNKLINYKSTKRGNINIVTPTLNELYKRIVEDEEELVFAQYKESLKDKFDLNSDTETTIIKGDIETDLEVKEQEKTLKLLRQKARAFIQEQGINVLYLSFGFLKWKESDSSSQVITSPIILVPVSLLIKSVKSPYKLSLYDDEIVLNPNLMFKLKNDFALQLPEFEQGTENISDYLKKFEEAIADTSWSIEQKTAISMLSFLKINMYKDLEMHEDIIKEHSLIKALCGDDSSYERAGEEFNNYNHDANDMPIDTYQVLDADASQQDAIVLAKRGVSFVLQGPPGTGKSQTITNIIAESLASGKKILFVSEKMAALDVVYNRLSQTGLSDFCLTLHSHKANKKEVLNNLKETLEMNKINFKEETLFELDILSKERNQLNEYAKQLHTKCEPLNKTIYEVNGMLSKLNETENIIFDILNVGDIDISSFNNIIYLLNQLSEGINNLSESYNSNAWKGCNVLQVTHELRHNIESNISFLIPKLDFFKNVSFSNLDKWDLNIEVTYSNIDDIILILEHCKDITKIPNSWLEDIAIDEYINVAKTYFEISNKLKETTNNLFEKYKTEFYNQNPYAIIEKAMTNMLLLEEIIHNKNFTKNDIYKKSTEIKETTYSFSNHMNNILEIALKISNILDIKPPETIEDINEVIVLSTEFSKEIKPQKCWFENISEIKNLLKDIESNTILCKQYKENLSNIYVKELYTFSKLYNSNDKYLEYINENTFERSFEFESDIESYKKLYDKIKTVFNDSVFNQNVEEVLGNLNKKLNLLKRYIDELDISISGSNITIEDITICKDFKTDISEIDYIIKKIVTKLEIIKPNKLAEIKGFINFLAVWNENIYPTESWFSSENIPIIRKLIPQTKRTFLEFKELQTEILYLFDKEILEIDVTGILSRFRTEYNSVFKNFKSSYKKDYKQICSYYKLTHKKFTDEELIEILQKLKLLNEKIKWFDDNSELLKTSFKKELLIESIEFEDFNFEEIEEQLTLFEKIMIFFDNEIPLKIKEQLLNPNKKQMFSKEIISLKELMANESISKYEKLFDTIINDDLILDSYIESLQNFILCNEDIYNNLNVSMCSQTKELNYEQHKEYLNYIIDMMEITKKYEMKSKNIITQINEINVSLKNSVLNFENCFGETYNWESTNFVAIFDRISIFESVDSYFQNDMSNNVVELMLNADNETILNKKLTFLIDNMNDENVEKFETLTKTINISKISIVELINKSEDIVTKINNLVEALSITEKNSCDIYTYEEHIKNLKELQIIKDNEKIIIDNSKSLELKFDFMFQYLDTNWQNVINALTWLNNTLELCKKYDFSKDFKNNMFLYENKLEFSKTYEEFFEFKNETINKFNYINNLFDDDNKLSHLNFNILQDKLKHCTNNITELENWVDFCISRNNCYENNLDEFVNVCVEREIIPTEIVNCFKKRFYTLWLDKYALNFSSISNFRRKKQEQLIENFRLHDTNQLLISRLRIKKYLLENIPDLNDITSSKGEVGILKRELAKRRNVMPIRKLMDSIPILLSKLKPCLMMSPLSVSLFLQSAAYNFDIVIFDEASQVCTENAIGAIMRAKQVIIAGDSKQLPPTSFFSTSYSINDDYDNEDTKLYESSEEYQSILDEALYVFDDKHLRWHYRSRHEDLITFSNRKIYNNSLITFPSNIQNTPNNGVEYIYVYDGIYDRGGKKNNIKEAEKVAYLVFDHFKNSPERSIGVITFSSSQQQAIDDEITKMRIENSEFENFFNEDIENAFFIKNLENVQGDERDTIIFSIGYAKDTEGRMFQNFGPLIRADGYRRLNVAITRAKYNLKLVGSILPTDITINETTSEGAKLLRKYVEFAKEGASVLDNEITYTQNINIESPFEESVYDYLIGKGFLLKTQIGCSGYRIDLAVEHPSVNGVFVLGIECDGASYHSSRTARERDRLRQVVLEDIGWRIYRIWSTDWIKDIEFEGNKLIDEINSAIKDYDKGVLNQKNDEILKEDSTYLSDIIMENDVTVLSNNEEFEIYKIFDVESVKIINNCLIDTQNLITNIVKNEYPIHIEMLYKRIFVKFEDTKITEKFKNYIKTILTNMIDEIIVKDDFLYPVNYSKIVPRKQDSNNPIKVEHISFDEISAAFNSVLAKSLSLTKDSLLQTTSKQFGFKKVTSKIKERFTYVLDAMIENKELIQIEDKIILP